jgi:hypothetical protein
MSHTVFLNASSRPRMPNGEAGEWASFWSDEKEELESNNGIPLLWWCLFNSNDIHKARLIDDGDVGSEERDELYDDIGDKEITYPYVVTSQETGLERLARRRDAVLAAIGREHAPTYDAFEAWLPMLRANGSRFLFPSRLHASSHISTRQYSRLVHHWVKSIGLEAASYGTHSMRRTKAAQIYRKTGNLRAIQLLLGHTKLESTVRYLGIEVDDALSMAEQIDL